MIRAEKLRAIVESQDDDFRTLAHLAGGHRASFYRGANFNDADLRGQDLRGYNLEAATFERARVDRHTKADEEYQRQMGMLRILVKMPRGGLVVEILKGSGVKLERPIGKHLGDILEDAVLEISKDSMFRKYLPEHDLPRVNSDGILTAALRNKILQDVSNRMTFDMLNSPPRRAFTQTNLDFGRYLAERPLHFTKMIGRSNTISVTSWAFESIFRMVQNDKLMIPHLCFRVLLFYSLKQALPERDSV